jgi:HemY protein
LKAGQLLVRDAAESAESHLLLARLSLEAGLTGEALRHAEIAERGGLRQRRVYVLLADIAEATGTDEQHREAYGDALRRAAAADPDPAWLCEACGATHETWQPACPNCHSAGRVRWGTPHRGVTALLPG